MPVDVELGVFASAVEVTLTTNLNLKLASSEDRQVIAGIFEVLEPLKSGWGVPWEGVAVTDLRLNFFGPDGKPLGNVGLSPPLVTAHTLGGFAQREVSPDVAQRCLQMIGYETSDSGTGGSV